MFNHHKYDDVILAAIAVVIKNVSNATAPQSHPQSPMVILYKWFFKLLILSVLWPSSPLLSSQLMEAGPGAGFGSTHLIPPVLTHNC